MLPMDRKHRYSQPKKNKTCLLQRIVKARYAGVATLNVTNTHFEIKQDVVDVLQEYAQHEGNELCGVLTGSQIGDNCFRISKASPPCVKKNSRCGCERDANQANAFIASDFEQSEQTRVYIGEWHTHPEPHPTPSAIDCNSIIMNYHTAKRAMPFLIMIIVGLETLYINVFDGEKFVKVDLTII